MPVSVVLNTIEGNFGAVSTFHFAADQAAFGGVEGVEANGRVTSLLVLAGSIRAVDTGRSFMTGEELQMPLASLCLVEALEPGTQVFHTLKPE